MERFTITKTRRYGHQDTQISHIYSATREKTKRDDVIRIANEMLSSESVMTNEEVEYEVLDPVLTVQQAMPLTAPLLHPNLVTEEMGKKNTTKSK